MGSFSTKNDINNMVAKIKEVKEKVVVNSINIEKLFELRKDDQDNLLKTVEEMIETKMSGGGGGPVGRGASAVENLRAE